MPIHPLKQLIIFKTKFDVSTSKFVVLLSSPGHKEWAPDIDNTSLNIPAIVTNEIA